MKKKLTIWLGVMACLILSKESRAQITVLQDYSNKYSASIGTFQGIQYREGGFSGMFPIAGSNGKEFWIVTDRGVNIDGANANLAGCRPTYDKIYAFPTYSPKILRVRVSGDSVQIIQMISIKRPNGTGATGIINPTGFGSTAAELASTDTVLNCSNFNLKLATKDVWGIDAEGVAMDKAGNFWICEEGGPTIWVVNNNGVVIKRYTPYANLPGAQVQDIMIDSCFKYRKNNRGFEGITIAPNGKVYAVIQSPILYPNLSTGDNSRVHRILEIDPVNNSNKMYVYLNDGLIGSGGNQIRLRDWKIGDMAAINDSTFLILEAALRGTTDVKRMYMVNINGATAVSSALYGGNTVEGLVDSAGLAAQGIKTVRKTLVMDFLALGWNPALDKIEGIAIINDSTIAISNDNDYGQTSAAQNGIATATGNTCHIVLYSLKGNNKLKNFVSPSISKPIGVTGPSTAFSPYMTPSASGVKFTSILTAGESAGNYRMCGLGDGLGAFDNNNGTFTLLINHEMGNNVGVTRAHGSVGAFVSKWVINKSDLSVQSGSDLIKSVYLWNGSAYSKYDAANPSTLAAFARFCSADLPAVSAFYNPATGMGTQERIFMNGEESGNEGRGFAHISTGANAGATYELPYLGKYSWENAVASPYPQNKTIVVGLDDATPGQVYFYIGTKTGSGTEIEKAGLSGGKLFGVAVNNLINESGSSIPSPGTGFSLIDLGQVQNQTGAYLNSASNNLGVTNFLRPEDGAWDPTNPNDFYFVTTNSFSAPSRMWRLRFTDITNPELGGTITAVLDGTEGQRMLDNIGFDNYGHVLLQEDPGNQSHIAKVWQYTVATDNFTLIGEHDPNRFISGGSNFLTQDEESSGIIDMESILGPGMFIVYDQAHYAQPGELVEGGQLLAMFNPETFNSTPELAVSGNNTDILNGDITASLTDHTDFGMVPKTQVRTFTLKNTAKGELIISKLEIKGLNAQDFSFLNAPALPIKIASNTSANFTVVFTPALNGHRTANVNLISNDNDESSFSFSIAGTGIDAGVSGPSSSQTPYLTPLVNGAKFTSILTVGDYVANYRMCGLADGTGAFDNGNGTFTMLINHEMGASQGVARAHGSKGAFVSKWVINKSDLTVLKGSDLIKTVYIWSGGAYVKYDVTNPDPLSVLNRFCSADLPAPGAFYNPATGLGTKERIFMNGEESGNEGRGFAHIATGANEGVSYELPYLGKFSWENAVASPFASNKTIVVGLDDATPGQVYLYIGNKTNTGNEIEKAGLSGGKLFGVAVAGLLTETSASVPAAGTVFTMKDLGQVHTISGATLNTNSNTAGVTNFLRPEDGLWDPMNPNDFYFVTTNSFTSPSRMWRLRFTDINNPELGGTISAVIDGTEGPKMMDNIGIDNFGHIMIQEDVGGNVHNGKIWQYTIATDALKLVAEHDQTRFISGSANFLTQDEESSGMIDAQHILGPGMFLLVDQAHYALPGELVEGGQILSFFNPDTYLENPEVSIKGNGEEIRNGSTAGKTYDHTDFGNIKLGQNLSLTFEINNTSVGNLVIKGISIEGLNASDFTVLNPPSFPLNLSSGASQTITVRFAPSAEGTRIADLMVRSNDYDESDYRFRIQGNGVQNTGLENEHINALLVYPNPSNTEATIELGLNNASEVQIKVLDLQGKMVMPESLYQLENGQHILYLNTTDLSSGIYIIEFVVNGSIGRYKLSVMH